MCHFPMIFAQWKRMYKEHFTEGWNIVICQTFEADHASHNYFIQQRGWLKNKIIGYIIFRGWKTISTKGIGNVHALRQQVWHISNSFVLSGVDVNTSYMCVTSITHVHNDITNVIFNHIFIFLLISIFVVWFRRIIAFLYPLVLTSIYLHTHRGIGIESNRYDYEIYFWICSDVLITTILPSLNQCQLRE